MQRDPSPEYPPISDYAIIGDCRAAALVSRDGSIDWLCWPQFDSPSIFARLLDWSSGGYFSITPVEPFRTERRYREDTNVLLTTFITGEGRATLTDLMPVRGRRRPTSEILPFRSILRRIEVEEGTVRFRVRYEPRLGYGRKETRLRSRGETTVYCSDRRHSLYLRSTEVLRVAGKAATCEVALDAGERADFHLAYSDIAPAVLPAIGDAATRQIDETIDYWQSWAGVIDYDGPWPEMVRRSALVLKLLSFAPSGAFIAAPTSSLPEWIGGERNWDYRYCWLRDASFTVRALYELGCNAEADSYVQWLMHATRLTHPRLNVIYDVYGETRLSERELDLEGYRRSRPVRVGNDAYTQVQIDIYGEVMSAVEHYFKEGRQIARSEQHFAAGIADYVADHWMDRDDGIWEERASRKHHIHGKVLCWSALDTAVRLAEEGVLEGDTVRWRRERDRIAEFVLERGWNPTIGSFVRTADGDDLDASALRFSMIGFLDGDSPEMLGTIHAIREQLAVGELVYRYRHEDDGISGDEGTFVACSFWLVGALARAGYLQEAERIFDAMIRHANDLGLYSEEIDPDSGALLGNFPQGLSHIALIHAATEVGRARKHTGRETTAR